MQLRDKQNILPLVQKAREELFNSISGQQSPPFSKTKKVARLLSEASKAASANTPGGNPRKLDHEGLCDSLNRHYAWTAHHAFCSSNDLRDQWVVCQYYASLIENEIGYSKKARQRVLRFLEELEKVILNWHKPMILKSA